MSFWSKLGESVGYGIGAVIFGPTVALERRRIRTIRRAFAEWLGDEKYTKLVPEPGRVRRLVERQDAELPFLLECQLEPAEGTATIAIALERPVPADPEELAPAYLSKPDVLRLETPAPQTASEWKDLADVAVQKAALVTRRYRGDGYR